jgi:hypothetical protein
VTVTGQAPQGWYPDPSDQRQLRWFDGAQWTAQLHTAPAQAAAPVTYAAPAYSQPQYAQQPQARTGGCQVCGATPALDVHLRGHQGMILLMRFITYRGRFCRDCGTATFRQVQQRTMLVGWWGWFSFVINTFTVGWNAVVSRRIAALGKPQGRTAAAKPSVSSVFKSPGFPLTLAMPLVAYFVFTSLYG